MVKREFFEVLTQVCFWEESERGWCAGVAYRDEIICGCCGSVIAIEDIYDEVPAEIDDPIIPFRDWVNLVDEIVGDDWPLNPFEEEEAAEEYSSWYFANLSDDEIFKDNRD